MHIQWYPGHMAKAKRQLIEQLKRVDAAIELCDARLPRSSRNPDLLKLLAEKPRLLVLNKADLSDEQQTKRWISRFEAKGERCCSFNATKGSARDMIRRMEQLTVEAVQRQAARGIHKTVRIMVVGVPNVGKSTFINRIHGKPIAEVADRPGVTRQTRWIRVGSYLELMDTPGMLWPKLDDQEAATHLSWLGTIRDDILDVEGLAISLLEALMQMAQGETMERYKIKDDQLTGVPLLEAVCFGRGFLMAGGRPNIERGAAVVLDEFRAGKMGRITLERAP